MPRPPRPHWTAAEDQQLTMAWGGRSGIDVLARQLGRTPGAVRHRAVIELRLGPMSGGRMSQAEAARYTGWDRDALNRAARSLDITWRTQPVSHAEDVGRRRLVAHRLLDVEQVDRLAAWLAEHGGQREGAAAPIPGGRKALRSQRAWVGRPCRTCGRTWTAADGERRGRPPVRCPECRR